MLIDSWVGLFMDLKRLCIQISNAFSISFSDQLRKILRNWIFNFFSMISLKTFLKNLIRLERVIEFSLDSIDAHTNW